MTERETPMATTNTRTRPSRKQDILEVFTEMVAERGYDAVAIRDVAEAMDISKGTILHHYGSKDRLLEQVHANYMNRRLREAEIILAELGDPPRQLAGLVYQNLLAMRHDHAATVAFAREIVRFASDPVMGEVREMRRRYSGLMRQVLARGMEQGDFRMEDPTMLSLQIFGMFNWSWTWLRTEGDWSIDELAASFLRTIYTGISKSDAATQAATQAEVASVVRSALDSVAADAPS
jgi:AcrR family transcriptional regulator